MTKFQKFVDRAKAKFGERFDYSSFVYVNAKTNSTIVCPDHGVFSQNPDKHLNSKYGCQKCANIGKTTTRKMIGVKTQGKKKEVEILEERLRSRLGDRFSYQILSFDGLTNCKVRIRCGIHGESIYNGLSLLMSEYGCRDCGFNRRNESKTKTFDEFVKDANNVHDRRYTYPIEKNGQFKTRRSKVTIVCATHGEFTKSAQKHLAGQGCKICKAEYLKMTGGYGGGYSPTLFENFPELIETPGVIYYIKVGRRYKIGITTQLNKRIKSIKSVSKQEVEVLDTKDMTIYQAYLLEQKILKDFQEFRITRMWTTELFERDVLGGKLP